MATSIEMFRRVIDKKFSDVQTAMARTIEAISEGTAESRKQSVEILRRACQDLSELLNQQDRPPWLQPVLASATRYDRDAAHAKQFLTTLLQHYTQIQPIAFADEQDALFDFDAIYCRIRDEGRIPELFDRIIELIREIIDSGAVEMITVATALDEVLAVLKKNRNASYLAARQSFSFACFVKNLAMVYLEKVPVLGECLEAWNRADEEMKREFQRADEKMSEQLKTTVFASLPKLERLQDLINEPLLRLADPARDGQSNASNPPRLNSGEAEFSG